MSYSSVKSEVSEKKKSIDLGLRANRLSTPLTKIYISGFPLIIVHLTTPFFVEICLN